VLGYGAHVKRFRGGLVFKAHRPLYHSTLGSKVMKKKREEEHVKRRDVADHGLGMLFIYSLESEFCCRANSAHTRQSVPDSGPGFRVKALKRFQGVPSSLSCGAHVTGLGRASDGTSFISLSRERDGERGEGGGVRERESERGGRGTGRGTNVKGLDVADHELGVLVRRRDLDYVPRICQL